MSSRKYIRFRNAVLLLITVTFSLGVAEGKKRAPSPPPTGLPVQINNLAKQLPGVMLQDAAPITSQIQKLVVDHMTEWMANRTPTDVEVRRELENVFSLLHYPEVALPASFAQPWKGELVVGAGYTLGWTDIDRLNVVAIFTSSLGKSRLVTVTDFVPRTDLHYEMLPQLAWDDLRFFIYGVRLGKSQPRLSVVLYSFDGQNLKRLWEDRDIYDGKMDILKDKITIRYLNEDEYVRAVEKNSNPPRHMSTYQLTPAGIQLVDDHDIPF
ncbi:MAG: hypothetical protein WAO35_18460 [Terriglobia bacterium]